MGGVKQFHHKSSPDIHLVNIFKHSSPLYSGAVCPAPCSYKYHHNLLVSIIWMNETVENWNNIVTISCLHSSKCHPIRVSPRVTLSPAKRQGPVRLKLKQKWNWKLRYMNLRWSICTLQFGNGQTMVSSHPQWNSLKILSMLVYPKMEPTCHGLHWNQWKERRDQKCKIVTKEVMLI